MKRALEHKEWDELAKYLLLVRSTMEDEKSLLAIDYHLIYTYGHIWPRRMPEFRKFACVEDSKVDLTGLMAEFRAEKLEDQAKMIDNHVNQPPPEPEVPVKKGKRNLN